MSAPSRGDEKHEAPDAAEVLVAVVEEERFRSKDDSFAVLRARRERDDREVIVVGPVAGLRIGELARFRGHFRDHATYGKQFQADSYVPVLPSTKRGLVRFLGSGLVPGVGGALAERLVSAFGDRTLDVITTESARLREVGGIGKKKAAKIAAAVRERRADAEGLAFLQGLGLGPALSKRVLKHYGARTAQQMREDPYRAAEEVAGIGFTIADRIGREVGIAVDDPRRAAGVVLHIVARAADQGHVFVPPEVVLKEALALEVGSELARDAIAELSARRTLVVEDEARIYAPPLHRAERLVAARLIALMRPRRPPERLSGALASIAGLGLAERQLEAAERSLTSGVLVLTGGPGTGKTTTIRAIVKAHETIGLRVLLCAPTGRAAKRMSEASGKDARTIHRLLEWSPALGSFSRTAVNPLDADVVLVDEASMLDIQLAAALLDAIGDASRLVLVGDVDQLPPVGAGQVLREVIASERCAMVRLEQVFRQAQASAIVRGAHEILAGRAPTSTPPGQKGAGDLFVIPAAEPEEVHAKILAALRRMPAAYQLDPRRDVQILAPMRKGALGTEALNALLQSELNAGATAREGAPPMRAGDKVMQLRNDYDKDVFNGDIGWVQKVEDGVVYVELEDRRVVSYADDELGDLTLAYASTIHKAQGSEFPAVVLVLHGAHWVMLSRALLYTGLTRARRLAVLIGEPRAIRQAARTARVQASYCHLSERLRASSPPG